MSVGGDSLAAQVDKGRTTLSIGGEQADMIAQEARARAGLWHDTIGALVIRRAGPGEELAAVGGAENPSEPSLVPAGKPPEGLAAGEPIAEGARRVLRRFFGRMLAREDGVLKDDDPEDVHQMRVASRRLRAALQIAEPIYDRKQLGRYRRGLRRVAQALADVRDLDVFHEHVTAYRAKLAETAQHEIVPLLAAVEEGRASARAKLVKHLKNKDYTKFKRAFAEFLTTPGAELSGGDIGPATRVRDFAGSAIWRRYEQWRSHEAALADPTDAGLHEARIAGKRLRYTLEFFADALGPNVAQVLDPLVALQECLGALQDAVVARQRIQALGLGDDTGVHAYLQARDAERAERLAQLPQLWEKVGSAAYRGQLYVLIVRL
jgi:CHAD domain-containing protein